MVLLTIADLGMIMPLTTWNLLDFTVVEKEKLRKHYLFAQPCLPGDHDCDQLFLQLFVFRKLLAEN